MNIIEKDRKELYTSLFRMFCSADENRPALQTPWKSESGHYFASDGNSLIMLPVDVIDLDFFDDTNTTVDKRPNAISVIPKERMEPVMILKEFIEPLLSDRVVKKVEGCTECGGRGQVECNYGHEHECPECDGQGELTVYDKMTIMSIPFRSELLQRLCKAMHWLGLDQIPMTHYGEAKAHLFELGQVTVLIMPIAIMDFEDRAEVKTLKKLI